MSCDLGLSGSEEAPRQSGCGTLCTLYIPPAVVDPDPAGDPAPEAPPVSLPREWAHALGAAVILQDRRRAKVWAGADQSLSRVTGQSEGRYLTELTGVFALWVADLPASEKHHHSCRFGLLDHSTQVAATFAEDLSRRWSSGGGGQLLTPGERTLWARTGYALALLHDIGKVLDLTVSAPGDREVWNPVQEPLALFKRRWGQSFCDPTTFKHHPRRGLRGHEAKGLPVVRALLSSMTWGGLGPAVLEAVTAYVNYHQPGSKDFPVPLKYLSSLTKNADGLDTSAEARRIRDSVPKSTERRRKGGKQ